MLVFLDDADVTNLDVDRKPEVEVRLLAFVRFDNDPRKPLSESEHQRWKLIAWIYLTVWLSIALFIILVLSVPTFLRIFLYLILVISAPALSDLFESYQAYLKRR